MNADGFPLANTSTTDPTFYGELVAPIGNFTSGLLVNNRDILNEIDNIVSGGYNQPLNTYNNVSFVNITSTGTISGPTGSFTNMDTLFSNQPFEKGVPNTTFTENLNADVQTNGSFGFFQNPIYQAFLAGDSYILDTVTVKFVTPMSGAFTSRCVLYRLPEDGTTVGNLLGWSEIVSTVPNDYVFNMQQNGTINLVSGLQYCIAVVGSADMSIRGEYETPPGSIFHFSSIDMLASVPLTCGNIDTGVFDYYGKNYFQLSSPISLNARMTIVNTTPQIDQVLTVNSGIEAQWKTLILTTGPTGPTGPQGIAGLNGPTGIFDNTTEIIQTNNIQTEALIGYSNQGYNVNVQSALGAPNAGFNCFDNITNGTSGWFSGDLIYDNVTGIYTGIGTKTISGVPRNGEWLTIQFPTIQNFSYYSIYGPLDNSKSPNTWYIATSTDGITWTQSDYQVDQSLPSSVSNYFLNNEVSTQHIMILVTRVGFNNLSTGRTQLRISELNFFKTNINTGFIISDIAHITNIVGDISGLSNGYDVSIINNDLSGHIADSTIHIPANMYTYSKVVGPSDESNNIALTANFGGPYTASASSDQGGTTLAYSAFDKSDTFLWKSISAKYTNGVANGAAAITNGYSGEWVQLDFITPTIVKSYKLSGPNTVSSIFRLFGSDDGTTWVTLHDQTTIYNLNSVLILDNVANNRYYRISTNVQTITAWSWTQINNITFYSLGVDLATSSYSFTNRSLNLTDATTSTNTTSGTLIVAGGVGISENVNIGGLLKSENTTEATTSTNASITTAGGVGILKDVQLDGFLKCNNTQQATSIATGAIRTAGGIGCGGSIYASGRLISIAGITSTNTTTGSAIITGGVGISENVNIGGLLKSENTTEATTSTNASITTAGGVGILKDVQLDGFLKCNNTQQATSIATGAIRTAGGIGCGGSIYTSGRFISIAGITSTNTTTGSAIITGGVGISENVNIGGIIKSENTTEATTSTNASITTAGGVGILKDVQLDGFLKCNNTQQATSIATGAIRTAGGIGCGGTIYTSGRFISIAGITSTNTTTGSAIITGGVGISENVNIGGIITTNFIKPPTLTNLQISNIANSNKIIVKDTDEINLISGVSSTTILPTGTTTNKPLTITDNTASSSISSGCLILSGGIGIADNIYSNGNLNLTNATSNIVVNSVALDCYKSSYAYLRYVNDTLGTTSYTITSVPQTPSNVVIGSLTTVESFNITTSATGATCVEPGVYKISCSVVIQPISSNGIFFALLVYNNSNIANSECFATGGGMPASVSSNCVITLDLGDVVSLRLSCAATAKDCTVHRTTISMKRILKNL